MRNLAVCCFLLLSHTLTAQREAIPASGVVNELNGLVNQLAESPDLSSAFIGFSLCDPKGKVLTGYHQHKAFVPASVMKVFTTAAALHKLGPAQVFNTRLMYSGSIGNTGVLQGHIIIKASGDPSLFSDRFDKPNAAATIKLWVAAIKAKGITQIKGAVITDASLFAGDPAADGWIRADMGNYFAPGIHALAYAENKYELRFAGGPAGTPAKVVSVMPPMDSLSIENYVTAQGQRDLAFLKSVPYAYNVWADGSIPADKSLFTVKGAIPDPPMLMARQLHEALLAAGIAVTAAPGTHRTAPLPPGTVENLIAEYSSPPLRDIVFQTNRRSVNIFAEHLLYMLSHQTVKTRKDGIEALKKIMSEMGVSMPESFFQDDGCGLSLLNLCSPALLTQLLAQLQSKPYFKDFYRSLPVAGESGTLHALAKGTPAAGKVVAKSGTMTGVKTYAGYVTGRSGTLYPFCIMVNNSQIPTWKVSKLLEPLMIKMTELD